MGAEMVRTDCRWGPEAGIIAGSDGPFSGSSPVLPECTISSEQTRSTRLENQAVPCILQQGKLREGQGLVHDPQQGSNGTVKLSARIPGCFCQRYSHPTVSSRPGSGLRTTLAAGSCHALGELGGGRASQTQEIDNHLRSWVVRQADPGGPPFPRLTVSKKRTNGWRQCAGQIPPASIPHSLDPRVLLGPMTSGLGWSLLPGLQFPHLQVLTQRNAQGPSPLHKMARWRLTPKWRPEEQASAGSAASSQVYLVPREGAGSRAP